MTGERIVPLVGLPACVVENDGMAYHKVGDKYLRAVAVSAGALPLAIPSLEAEIDVVNLVAHLDGLLLTGSPSNVHPSHYGEAPSAEAEPHDPQRDATTLPLIQAALDQAVPLLAICRGFQELNVALGGTLHARVHEVEGRSDHRRPRHPDLDVQYGARHLVHFTPDGRFARLAERDTIEVNSLHWQAIKEVAEGLAVEGRAPDDTVEAVSVKGAKAFALGVQWHPEYRAWDESFQLDDNDFSRRLFKAFGEAARARAEARRSGAHPAGQVTQVA